MKAERGDGGDFSALQDDVDRLGGALTAAEAAALGAKTAHSEARQQDNEAREAASRAKLRAQELETEVQTLTKLLKPSDSAEWLPIVQDVRAEPGYELGAGRRAWRRSWTPPPTKQPRLIGE